MKRRTVVSSQVDKVSRPRQKLKYNTADKRQEYGSGTEDVSVKPVSYKQGSKCKHFSYVCKLQSVGDQH